MNKPISPKWHAILDYALVGSLVVLPKLMHMNRKARCIYAVEAAVLLPYIALTKQPLAIKGLIPFKTHKKIDFFNVSRFAVLTLLPAFRKHKKEIIFNTVFTLLAGTSVALTKWTQK